MFHFGKVLLSSVCLLCLATAMLGGDEKPVRKIDYNRDIRPILAKNCFTCHGSDDKKRSAGLRLDERDAAITSRKKHPAAILPGKADSSLLIEKVLSDDDAELMPPPETGSRLTSDQIHLLKLWINQGAEYQKHWSFVAPGKPILPATRQTTWAKQPLDQYILAELEKHHLKPSPEADRYTLLRRLSLDLRGLPPTLDEIAAFEKDTSPNAYEKQVDRFLADPAYGERWARVWLDLARYADSAGYGSDPLRLNMWRYRDWVIDAFNKNMPYDQFTIEQLAGDLLPNATMEQRMATAFHRNTMTNTEGGTDDEEFRVAAVKDRINTTMQVWMGLTMGCAQCHNHKYDPISQAEYYQGYAIFNQTTDNDQPNEAPTMPAPTLAQLEKNQQIDGQIAAVRKKLDQATPDLAKAQAAWEETVRSTTPWIPLQAVKFHSKASRLLQKQPDGSIHAATVITRPGSDTYTITTQPKPGTYTGLQLETFPHEARDLVAGKHNRNFVISQVKVGVQPISGARPRTRFVRVTLPGMQRILSLAEVQVFQDSHNLARYGDASQSSTDFHGDAIRAIDGKTNGDFYESNSVTHSRLEDNPWWEVKLSTEANISRIVLWNRTGGVENRLQGAIVQLLDVNHTPFWEQKLGQVPMPMVEIDTTTQPVALGQAVADFSQGGFGVENLLKPKQGIGWSIAPQVTQKHHAQLIFKEPLTLTENEQLVIKIEQQAKQPNVLLDRFRLSLSTDPRLAARAAIPPAVLEAIDYPVEARSGYEAESIARYYRTIAPELQPQRDEIARLDKSRPAISPLPVMQELTGKARRVTKLMKKGNFLDAGDVVEPRLPALFQPDGLSKIHATRHDLARWLVHPENPLTARVAVNRLWAQLFGTGLVESEEDFGTQGDVPSHPELLNYLAWHFQHDLKWNTKAMLKDLVMSATYRQSSKVTPELLEKDPRNQLLSSGPRYRLEAEMVRDQALALAGLLNKKIGGPSVFPKQPDGLWQAAFNGERTWMTSRGDEKYRRGLYTFWRRTIPYPSMAAFDAPSREICQIKRIRSNTPVQAFVTLNDPVYVEAAQALARRIVKEGGKTTEERLRYALRLVQGRPVDEKQVKLLLDLYRRELFRYCWSADAASKLATDPLGPLPAGMHAVELASWTVIANVLLNLDGVLMKG